MVVCCNFREYNFKMSDLSALLLLQLVTMVSKMHSETRRLCQNNRFPTVQGFTQIEVIQVASWHPTVMLSCLHREKANRKVNFSFNPCRCIM